MAYLMQVPMEALTALIISLSVFVLIVCLLLYVFRRRPIKFVLTTTVAALAFVAASTVGWGPSGDANFDLSKTPIKTGDVTLRFGSDPWVGLLAMVILAILIGYVVTKYDKNNDG